MGCVCVVLVFNCVCITHACNELSVKNMLLLWTLAVLFLWPSSKTRTMKPTERLHRSGGRQKQNAKRRWVKKRNVRFPLTMDVGHLYQRKGLQRRRNDQNNENELIRNCEGATQDNRGRRAGILCAKHVAVRKDTDNQLQQTKINGREKKLETSPAHLFAAPYKNHNSMTSIISRSVIYLISHSCVRNRTLVSASPLFHRKMDAANAQIVAM